MFSCCLGGCCLALFLRLSLDSRRKIDGDEEMKNAGSEASIYTVRERESYESHLHLVLV